MKYKNVSSKVLKVDGKDVAPGDVVDINLTRTNVLIKAYINTGYLVKFVEPKRPKKKRKKIIESMEVDQNGSEDMVRD